jgi:pimeloyl-ACP methyl ester carboxylesterase
VYSVWQRISAPVLWVAAADSSVVRRFIRDADASGEQLAFLRDRLARVRNGRLEVVEEAGHMLHHDQPQAVARLLEPFLE